MVIQNEKGRLSQEEIERMVAEAEQFKEEDDAEAERIEAKNNFEGVVYGLRTTVQDDKLEGRWLRMTRSSFRCSLKKL